MKLTRESSVKSPFLPPSVTEEYGRPGPAGPLLPSDYSRGSTPRNGYRVVKRRIKTRVSAVKLSFYHLEHNNKYTVCKTHEVF